jgi:hypothetical protein
VSYVNINGQPLDVREMERLDRMARMRREKPPRRKPTVKNGYAAVPGTGPEGETCKTCKYKVSCGHYGGKHYLKCELRKATWTNGEGTDILARSPACSKWEAA